MKEVVCKLSNPRIVQMRGNELVERLEQLLDLAKNGKIRNFVGAGYYSDDEVFTVFVNTTQGEEFVLNGYLNARTTQRFVLDDE